MKQPGQIILADEIDSHLGKFTALEGQKLVAIFLGTTPKDQVPAITPIMNSFGWFQASLIEAEVEIQAGERHIKRTIFRAETLLEGAEGAVRFARRQVMDLGGEMISLVVHVVKIGTVGEDGVPAHARAGRVLVWDADCGSTLDALVAGLAL